jgi:hypothetical protein
MANKIRIGMCMAGAVSAGAYTAGVMDYFIEALDRLEEARKTNPDLPEVIIDTLSGTSAGGMTALIAAAALHREMVHIDHTNFRNPSVVKKNPLFQAWINLTDNEQMTTIEQMCATDDISSEVGPEPVAHALFNSKFIDDIANHLVDGIICQGKYVERSYVAKDLQIFACMSNLRGFEVAQVFNSETATAKHTMQQHRDLGHFEVTTNDSVSKGRLAVNFKEPKRERLQLYRDVAMATGAFPIGLRPRMVTRPAQFILDNEFINPDRAIQLPAEDGSQYAAMMVDGGAFNNEPYDITMKLVKDRAEHMGDYHCVIMIDPIPNLSPTELQMGYKHPKGLIQYGSAIISALRSETNCKMPLDQKNVDSSKDGLFLIKPSRRGGDDVIDNVIACAALNRFGGFFSKRFREHDYLLGRRNCKSFLLEHFKMAFEGQEAQAVFPLFLFKDDNGIATPFGKQYLIPYPKMHADKLFQFKASAEQRFEAVLPNILHPKRPIVVVENETKLLESYLGRPSWLKRKLGDFVEWIVKKMINRADGYAASAFVKILTLDLHKRGQLTHNLSEDRDVPPIAEH